MDFFFYTKTLVFDAHRDTRSLAQPTVSDLLPSRSSPACLSLFRIVLLVWNHLLKYHAG